MNTNLCLPSAFRYFFRVKIPFTQPEKKHNNKLQLTHPFKSSTVIIPSPDRSNLLNALLIIAFLDLLIGG